MALGEIAEPGTHTLGRLQGAGYQDRAIEEAANYLSPRATLTLSDLIEAAKLLRC